MNNNAEQIHNSDHGPLLSKSLTLSIVVVLSLGAAVSMAQAQRAVDLEHAVVALGQMRYVKTQNRGRSQITLINSDNPNVATARKCGTNGVQIIPHWLGKATIEFWDNAEQKLYQVPVAVIRAPEYPEGVGGTNNQPDECLAGADAREESAGDRGAPGHPDPHTGVGAQESDLFNNFNIEGTENGPRRQTVFTLNRPATITGLATYHWNSGRGARPGTIGLRDQSGKIYGPFPASGSAGQRGAMNVDWVVELNLIVPAGTYTVLDSNPRTWSHNAQSGWAGFVKVRGYFLTDPAPPISRIPLPHTRTNLIQNGSFEIGPDPGSFFLSYNERAEGIPNWRVTTRTIDYIGSLWRASDGMRSVDLDGTPGAGGIAQSFATVPGQEYIVAFDLAGNAGCPPANKEITSQRRGTVCRLLF